MRGETDGRTTSQTGGSELLGLHSRHPPYGFNHKLDQFYPDLKHLRISQDPALIGIPPVPISLQSLNTQAVEPHYY
jgi:hypothetical protein